MRAELSLVWNQTARCGGWQESGAQEEGLMDFGKKLLMREGSRHTEHQLGLEFPGLRADF